MEGDLVVLCDVEAGIEYLAVSDLLKLTDGIRPSVLEIAISVACKIGQISSSGKNIGSIIILGDSVEVLRGSRQLIPNPFQATTMLIAELPIPTPRVQSSSYQSLMVPLFFAVMAIFRLPVPFLPLLMPILDCRPDLAPDTWLPLRLLNVLPPQRLLYRQQMVMSGSSLVERWFCKWTRTYHMISWSVTSNRAVHSPRKYPVITTSKLFDP